MLELPELTPESFEILVVRELRKVGLQVSELRIHRCSTLPDPERGYLLELKGVLGRGPERRPTPIACLRGRARTGPPDIEAFKDNLQEPGVEPAVRFGTAVFEPEALTAAQPAALALLRVTDGRTAFDTSGWGTPGHYPAWLPAYCAETVGRDLTHLL